MARPRRSEHTREALIETGIEQLSEHGYHGTGIKQILDAVKVPKGSFYNYFASKEQFVAEILDEYNKEGIKQLDAFTQTTDLSPLDQIKAIYGFMLAKFSEHQCQRGCLIGSIAAEIGSASEQCQKSMLKAVADWRKRFTDLIDQAQQQGQIRKDMPASEISEVFWSAWEGSLIRMKMEGRIDPARQTLDLMLNKLLAP